MNSLNRFPVGSAYACCLLAVLSTGCNITIGPSLRGSGVAKTESREVAQFSEIEVGSAIQLDVTVGEPTSLVVTADDNVLPSVRTEVVGDRLKIYLDTSLSTNIGVQVKASTPELKSLVGSGAHEGQRNRRNRREIPDRAPRGQHGRAQQQCRGDGCHAQRR